MPHTRGTTVLALALGLLLAPLAGCETQTLRMQLAGFGDGDVDGVWIWRYSTAQGRYQRVCRIELSNPSERQGQELVTYMQVCLDDRPRSPTWQTAIERLPADADAIEVSLVYLRWGPVATYKATAYNAAGESALSQSTIQL